VAKKTVFFQRSLCRAVHSIVPMRRTCRIVSGWCTVLCGMCCRLFPRRTTAAAEKSQWCVASFTSASQYTLYCNPGQFFINSNEAMGIDGTFLILVIDSRGSVSLSFEVNSVPSSVPASYSTAGMVTRSTHSPSL